MRSPNKTSSRWLDCRQHFQSSFALDRISIPSLFRRVDGDAFPRIECTLVSRDGGQLSHPRRAHLSSYFCRHFCFSMPLSVRARVCGGARRKNFTFRNVSTSISPRQYDTLRQPYDRTLLLSGKNKIHKPKWALRIFLLQHFAFRDECLLPRKIAFWETCVFCNIGAHRDLKVLLEI